MAEILRVPIIITHEVANGGTYTGVAPDGDDSEETYARGLYRIWENCTVAGLIELPDDLLCGFTMRRVMITSTGPTAWAANLIDPDGVAVPCGALAAGDGFIDYGGNPILVPPGFKFQVIGTGACTADSRVIFQLAIRWPQTALGQSGDLGRDARPPGKPTP